MCGRIFRQPYLLLLVPCSLGNRCSRIEELEKTVGKRNVSARSDDMNYEKKSYLSDSSFTKEYELDAAARFRSIRIGHFR